MDFGIYPTSVASPLRSPALNFDSLLWCGRRASPRWVRDARGAKRDSD